MKISRASDGREAWIDDDQLGSVIAGLPDPVRERWECFADIRAANHDDFGMGQIGIVVRSTVQAEGFFVSRPGTDHAQPAVVIQIPGLERHARELSNEVALFIRQRNA